MAQISIMETATAVQLLREAIAQGLTYAQVTNGGRLVVGLDPLKPTSVVDFSAEQILPLDPDRSVPQIHPLPAAIRPKHKLSRQTGRYILDFKGTRAECQSLKELLAEGLRRLEESHPGMLEKLAKVKPRTKRIVAHNPQDLFDQKNLVQDYSEKLMQGWWFGTNNSADETITWLKRASELCALEWGKDFSTSLG